MSWYPCCCLTECILHEDAFERMEIGEDWDQTSGTWAIGDVLDDNWGEIQGIPYGVKGILTSDADAAIEWAFTHGGSLYLHGRMSFLPAGTLGLNWVGRVWIGDYCIEVEFDVGIPDPTRRLDGEMRIVRDGVILDSRRIPWHQWSHTLSICLRDVHGVKTLQVMEFEFTTPYYVSCPYTGADEPLIVLGTGVNGGQVGFGYISLNNKTGKDYFGNKYTCVVCDYECMSLCSPAANAWVLDLGESSLTGCEDAEHPCADVSGEFTIGWWQVGGGVCEWYPGPQPFKVCGIYNLNFDIILYHPPGAQWCYLVYITLFFSSARHLGIYYSEWTDSDDCFSLMDENGKIPLTQTLDVPEVCSGTLPETIYMWPAT